MLTKDQILAAIDATILERRGYINVKSVLIPFITDLTRVSVCGFFTTVGHETIIEMINRDYLDEDSPDITNYIEGSAEMILDFVIIFLQNLKSFCPTAMEDIKESYSFVSEIITSEPSIKDSEAGNFFNLEDRGYIMAGLYLIRTNLVHITNLIRKGEGDI